MTRQLEHPVSFSPGLSVLVPAQKGERQDGSWNFDRASAAKIEQQPIRELTDDDIEHAKETLTSDEYQFLEGVKNIAQGFETNDEKLRMEGFRKLGEKRPEAWAAFAWGGAVRLQIQVSERISKVRLIMWFQQKGTEARFVPAFDCPDLATGIMVKTLIGDVRICPHCGKPFLPHASNVLYCTPAHRDAYRLKRARWRGQNKAAKKQTKKGVKHGKR